MIILILPAHNEQDNIGYVLQDAHNNLNNLKLEHKFVVVNDGSTDRTADVVMSYTDNMPIYMVGHKTKMGIRFAFMSGFKKACELSENEDDIIIMLEADNTLDLNIISEMLEKMKQGYDVVSASRFVHGGRYVGFPYKRLILSIGSNFLLRIFFHLKGLSDYTIFFRAYKGMLIKKAIEVYCPEFIRCEGFAGNVEFLIKLNQIQPLKISEVPLIYSYDNKMGKSKMNIYKTTMEYLRMILNIFVQSRRSV